MSQRRMLDAVTNLRRASADVVTLCDLIIYGSASESRGAQRRLVTRINRLARTLQHAQTALSQEGRHE